MRQRMKLTGTNSSIGLIVLIDYAHLPAKALPSSGSMMLDLCPDAPMALRTARATKRDGLWPVWVPQAPAAGRDPKTCSKKRKQANACQLLKTISCALPTWWLWRGGCTRSHSEHGRETPLRPWYFVSRRGRVGRCQVCKSQLKSSLCISSTAHAVTKSRSQAAFRVWCHRNTRQIASNLLGQ